MPETTQPRNLIDGRLYTSPAPFWLRQEITLEVASALRDYARRAGGNVFIAPMDCRPAEGLMLQPDAGYISPERAHIIQNHVMGAPDLVVEVLSQGTRKLAAYGRNGVREAWLVDPDAECVPLFLGMGRNGRRDVGAVRRGSAFARGECWRCEARRVEAAGQVNDVGARRSPL